MKSRVRASVVVIHNDRLLSFLGVDPKSGREYFFLPGGAIEEDETATEAAERETFEETGFKVKVDPAANVDREYIFHWNGEDHDCLTIFYRANLVGSIQQKVKDAEYNKGVHWIPLAEVPELFNYNAEILSAIQELIGH
ncbi:MAG TPA: NUDIX domain-containing protein [Bdellovibrionales bacterium]|nr:NUDIX domain-containing protein [Bdellovibrionales bacterium]